MVGVATEHRALDAGRGRRFRTGRARGRAVGSAIPSRVLGGGRGRRSRTGGVAGRLVGAVTVCLVLGGGRRGGVVGRVVGSATMPRVLHAGRGRHSRTGRPAGTAPVLRLPDACRGLRPRTRRAAREQYGTAGACRALGFAEGGRLFPALCRQQVPPAVGGQEGAVEADVGVVAVPEGRQQAVQQGEGGLVVGFDGQEEAAGVEEAGEAGEGVAYVACGVQGAGGDHEVEVALRPALVGGVAVEVEDAEVDVVAAREALPQAGEEGLGGVGTDVAGAVGRQFGQQVGRGAAGAGADLEDAQRAVGGPVADQGAQERAGRPVRGGGEAAVGGQFLQQVAVGVRQQQFRRVAPAAQHVDEPGGAGADEAQLHGEFGVVGGRGAELLQRCRRTRQPPGTGGSAGLGQAVCAGGPQEQLEQRGVVREGARGDEVGHGEGIGPRPALRQQGGDGRRAEVGGQGPQPGRAVVVRMGPRLPQGRGGGAGRLGRRGERRAGLRGTRAGRGPGDGGVQQPGHARAALDAAQPAALEGEADQAVGREDVDVQQRLTGGHRPGPYVQVADGRHAAPRPDPVDGHGQEGRAFRDLLQQRGRGLQGAVQESGVRFVAGEVARARVVGQDLALADP